MDDKRVPLLKAVPVVDEEEQRGRSSLVAAALEEEEAGNKEVQRRDEISLTRAHLYLCLAALIHSGYTVVLFSNSSSKKHKIPATLIGFCREFLAVPMLYAYARCAEGPEIRWPKTPKDIRTFLCLGVVTGAYQLCLVIGVGLTGSADTAALFQSIEPSIAAILAAAVGAELCGWRKVASALLAGAGIAVLEVTSMGGSSSKTSGLTFFLGCAVLFLNGILISTFTLLQKSLVDSKRSDRWGPKTVIAHAFCVSLVVVALALVVSSLAGLENPIPLSKPGLLTLISWRSAIVVFYSAVFSSLLSFTLRATANTVVDASTLVLYNATQPPFTAILSFLIFAVPLGPMDGVAMALIVSAVLIAVFDPQKKTRRQLPRRTTPVDDEQPPLTRHVVDLEAA